MNHPPNSVYIYSTLSNKHTEYPSIERPSSIVSPDIASETREVNGRSGESWRLAQCTAARFSSFQKFPSIERKDGTGEKRLAITRLISTRSCANRERRWRQVFPALIIESLGRWGLFVRNSWFAWISSKPVAPWNYLLVPSERKDEVVSPVPHRR